MPAGRTPTARASSGRMSFRTSSSITSCASAIDTANPTVRRGPMAADHKLAVLGAGSTMGFPMARNLARAGFQIRAWNRTQEKAQALSEDGAELFESPAEAVEGAEIMLTMVADA